MAVKLAISGSEQAAQLHKEASAYLAMQDLWSSDIPELLLAGPLHACGRGYGLGTALLQGRALSTGAA